MIDRAHLQDKQIVFRFISLDGVYSGVVKQVESDGLWIESPLLFGQLATDLAWKVQVQSIQGPVLFVPTSSLLYLIVSGE